MKGLLLLVAASLACVPAGGGAASVHKRDAVSPSAVNCMEATGPFPNPSDCGSFLQCEPSGNIVTHQCPSGLEFNARLGVCDYAENAGCSEGSGQPPAEATEAPVDTTEAPVANVETTAVPSQEIPAEDGSGDDSGDQNKPVTPSIIVPICPDIDNPDEAIQLPNPSDCGSFYKCDASKVAWLMPCPAGLEYNAQLKVCDYPENAGCSSTPSPEAGEEKPTDDTPQDDNEDDADTDDDGDSDSVNPPADAPACPAIDNPEEAIQLPNPNDCSSFYKCDAAGVAWLIPCPGGLEYNAQLRVCDYPENAGCSSTPSTSGSEDDPSEDSATEATDGNDETDKPVSPSVVIPACPTVENPEEAIQLPNPSDCSSFYKCDAIGVAWLITCPAGLQYNAQLGVCDYPDRAGCSPVPSSEGGEEEN